MRLMRDDFNLHTHVILARRFTWEQTSLIRSRDSIRSYSNQSNTSNNASVHLTS